MRTVLKDVVGNVSAELLTGLIVERKVDASIDAAETVLDLSLSERGHCVRSPASVRSEVKRQGIEVAEVGAQHFKSHHRAAVAARKGGMGRRNNRGTPRRVAIGYCA